MLRELIIRNFAIIDDLTAAFEPGFTVLSGETGAGKSIIISAVNLLLGARASAQMVRTGADSAELNAFFDVAEGSPTAAAMATHGFDPSEGLLIRRVISAKGQHRVYVNGRPATMAMLTDMVSGLASISGQHANQDLLKEEEHLLSLDRFAGLMPLRESVAEGFRELIPLVKKRDALKEKFKRQGEHRELLAFQAGEIRAAALSTGEDAALELEKNRLKNAEALFATADSAARTLYADQGAVVEQLAETAAALEKAANIDPELAGAAETLRDAAFRVEDVSRELTGYAEQIQMDEARLAEVEDRLVAIGKLKRKYGDTIEKILIRADELEAELAGLDHMDDDIREAEARIGKARALLSKSAATLSEQRSAAAEKLSRKIEAQLSALRMEKARFGVEVSGIPADDGRDPAFSVKGRALTETGLDRARFLIAPNVGEQLRPLAAIASGGELSRVILALKVILAENDAVSTVVFDEVDAGIGGGVAELVGEKLAELGKRHQVVCITHLAQIARFGEHHFRIEKQEKDGRTATTITPLSNDERVNEIARMMGGLRLTQTTLDHAREMLGR